MKNLARIAADGREQPLAEHLKAVAHLTSESLPASWQQVGYYTGLWHDLGKYIQSWQQYLRGTSKKKNHSSQGAMLAIDRTQDLNKMPAIALAIAAHHTGLKRPEDLETARFEEDAKDWEKAREIARTELADIVPSVLPDIDLPSLRREFAIRMLFSALVDADRFDAMNFEASTTLSFNAERSRGVEQNLGNPRKARASLPSKKCFNPRSLPISDENLSPIDKLRNDFAAHCIASAQGAKGLYRLTGACGIGKTKTSLRWGLLHARHHQMKGIIYVGPLKVIIEQTAEVYRELLGADAVLEHHSSYEPKPRESRNYKLDTERWDKPYIVTSGVQFYESLFSNRPGQCRKLHNISNRVILIDEAQTIPLHLAKPILDVLETLTTDWGCTVVLMSATQPAFDRLELCHNAVDIVEPQQVVQQYQALKRVTYRPLLESPWTWNDLAKDIIESGFENTLTVLNTTTLAREGYQSLRSLISGRCFHLSARMCPAHRTEVLQQVNRRLASGEDCHLISTQLIEAGVDVDFPRTYRQLAPLDSIIQTAGRCNRNAKLAPEEAIATIFRLQNTHPPSKDYALRTEITQAILTSLPGALDDAIFDAIRQYFQAIYNKLRAGGDEVQAARYAYNYPRVSELFEVIGDDTLSVVVPWRLGRELIEQFQHRDVLTQAEWRQVQPYSATVSGRSQKLERLGNGLIVWTGIYDPDLGCLDT